MNHVLDRVDEVTWVCSVCKLHYGSATVLSICNGGAGSPLSDSNKSQVTLPERCRGASEGSTSNTAELIVEVCEEVKTMLLDKNASYGDSATRPLRVMSKADPIEQIKVRIDDKLSRIMRGNAYGEDVVMDLIGYFILLRVAEKGQKT